jgi:DNA polymerase IV (archaeal DinB-like DNA polymerase)
MAQIIFHCDLDAFFASVEIRDHPEYKNRPVIIGADPKKGKGRGVVSTCNYKAREYGLHSALPISQAYKKCPQGIYLRPNFLKYKKASQQVMQILNSFSEEFQQVSVDEAYVDMSERCKDFDEAKEIAKAIQKSIMKEVGITMSIGVASTKSIAKIASDYHKPNGTTIVRPEEVKRFLSPLEITRIPGIGKKSKFYYNKRGIFTIGDIIKTPLNLMIQKFGKSGSWAWRVANGLDNRSVKAIPDERKSISKERTFYEDTADFSLILSKLEEINKKIHDKLKQGGVYYKTITLKIRFQGFLTYTRSKSLPFHIQDEKTTIDVILELYKEFLNNGKKVRLVGIKLSNLSAKDKIQRKLISYL